jgi:putative ABC transport system permease protein
MIANYLKIGFRILYRQRSYTLLNIVGLSIGIAVFVFIYLYIQNEVRYDRSWTGYQQIYRVWNEYALDNNRQEIAISPFRLASDLRDGFPGVQSATKIFFTDPSDVNDMASLTYDGKVYEVPDITISDNSLFKIFDFEFTEGSHDSALIKPNSIVISESVARQIFGNQPALGKKLHTVIREYTVTGVFNKTCLPTHLNFDAVVSESSLTTYDLERRKNNWFLMNVYTYVKLDDTVNVERLQTRFNNFVNVSIGKYIDSTGIKLDGYTKYHFELVTDVHFDTRLAYDSPTNVDFSYLIIFGIIAAFILLTASINYINLAMARSLKRAKEIGVRKVLGAQRKQLAMQHLSEAFIVTTIAFILSLSLVEVLMPQFNSLVGKNLTLVGTLFSSSGIIFGLILIIMIIFLAFISGIFPAFILSTFNPGNVLKGNNFFFSYRGKQKLSAGGVRKILVTIQYIVSVGMIIATSIIYSQMSHLKNQDIGFNKNNVMVINVPDDTTFNNRSKEFLTALQQSSGVTEVSGTHSVPGYTHGKLMFNVGDTSKNGLQSIAYYAVDKNFFKTLGIKLLDGKFFENGMEEDSIRKYIVNETAARYYNFKDPVGEKLDAAIFEEQKGEVIGVVNDFYFYSLHKGIEPLVFMLWPQNIRYILVRINPVQKEEAMAGIQSVWNKYNQGHFMHFTFLDDKLNNLYADDLKMLSLFIYFSIFVIFISSLGLYGLSSFLIEQRTKEIGIRKVLGGGENRITLLLAKDYLMLVLIAGLIATPIVYFLLNRWLNSFSYHITLNAWYFLGGILIALAFAFTTVFIRSYKVVRQSPSIALKYE